METREAIELVLKFMEQAEQRDGPVIRLQSPDQLQQVFEEAGVPLPMDSPQEAHSNEETLRALQAVLDYSVHTQHPRFFNQNFAGPDPVAVVGDWFGAALNTTNATYEAAPVFTMMEHSLLQKLAATAGMKRAEGLFGAGGSLSNLLAMHLARHHLYPQANEEGVPPSVRLVAYTSEHAHYSLKKAAALMGLGYKNLRTVTCDATGRMLPDALEEAILQAKQQGETPFFLNATAGTTVTGAFDPFVDLLPLAREHGLWFHVDGCYGASALFSEQHKHLMEGVEQADSLAWNLHKMMGITQQCSALLVAHPGLLKSCFATGASYLFQPDKEHAALDSGDQHFQCARRVDVLKLWLTWKVRGDQGFTQRVDKAVDNARQFTAMLQEHENESFVLALPPSFTNVCFWWLPPHLRGVPPEQWTQEDRQTLHGLAPQIKRKMQENGTAMLGFQSLNGLPNFFRMICINSVVDTEDLRLVLDLIKCYGDEAIS